MVKRVGIRLAAVPRFVGREYHPDQVALYSTFTDLVFKALRLPSVSSFLEGLAEELSLVDVEVRVCRMPSRRSKIHLAEGEGGSHLVLEELRGRIPKEGGPIDIYPGILWPRRSTRPRGRVGIRGFVLNISIRTVIHEMLHRSGLRDEGEVIRPTGQHYNAFRRTRLKRFNEEFKPLQKKWKEAQQLQGL